MPHRLFLWQATAKVKTINIHRKKDNKKCIFLNFFWSEKDIILLCLENNNGPKMFLRLKHSKLPRHLLLFLSIFSPHILPVNILIHIGTIWNRLKSSVKVCRWIHFCGQRNVVVAHHQLTLLSSLLHWYHFNLFKKCLSC